MAGPELKYGRPVGGPEIDYAWIGNGYQRACVYDNVDEEIIVYALGVWAGRRSGSPRMRLGIGYAQAGANGNPTSRIAYTGEVAPATMYTDITGGVEIERDIAPFVLSPQRVALVVTADNGEIGLSMRAAAGISAENRNFFDKAISGTVPTNPIGGTRSYNGHLSMWLVGEKNVAPNTPSGLGRDSVSALRPTFYSTFSDANEVLNNGASWDYLAAYQVRLRAGSASGSILWDETYTASSSERSAGRTARFYNGPGLRYETPYTYQVRHRDRNGAWSNWASWSFTIAVPNSKPNRPGNLEPSGSAIGTDLTPVLRSTYSDPDEVLSTGQVWDYLDAYRIRVVRQSDGAVMWDQTFNATTTERSQDRTERTYNGTPLAYNTTYRYLIRHRDRAGAWSDWGFADFSITSLSTADKPTAPTGFLKTDTIPDIRFVYRHGGGVAMDAMQVRLLTPAGSVIASGGGFGKVAAANTTVSVSWTQAGLSDEIEWGGEYGFQVRTRDANAVWSPSWSPVQTFRMDAAPLVPTNLSPSGSRAYAARPLLTCVASDPDPEDPPESLTVYAEILDDAGAMIGSRKTMIWSTARKRFEYQTTAADLPGYAAYKWRAYSLDGFLFSGGARGHATASRSGIASFVYALVPEVTITGPASPIATISPRIEWATTGQIKYRVRLFRPGTETVVYDSGEVTSTDPYHDVVAGNWINELWNTGETFNAVVSIQDSTTLWGESAAVPITLEFTPPPSLSIEAFLHTLANTHGTNAVRLAWEMTAVEASDFEKYTIDRIELLADGMTERPGSYIPDFAETTDPTMVELLDAEVTSRQLYRYGIRQHVRSGNDVLVSEPTYVTAVVQWDGVILHCPVDPEALHVELRVGPPGDPYEPELQSSRPMRLENPVGTGGRVAFFGPGQSHDPSGTFGVISDELRSADDRLDDLYAIYDAQGGDWDGRPHSVCWREGRGGRHGRIYGVIAEPRRRHARSRSYVVELEIQQVAFQLGVGGSAP